MSSDLNWLERTLLRRAAMNWLRKHWGNIVAIAGPAIAFLEPSLKAYLAEHPHTALGVLIGVLLALYNARAPKDKG